MYAGRPGITLARLAAATLSLLCWMATAHAAPLAEDAARPAFETRDRHLREALAQRGDQPVILNFWAPWCAPCRAEMPALQRLADRWRGRGVAVLTVNVADRSGEGGRFLWDAGVVLPVLNDPDQAIARALGVRTLPMTLVLDRAHRIAARGGGAIDWDAKAVDRQLASLLN